MKFEALHPILPDYKPFVPHAGPIIEDLVSLHHNGAVRQNGGCRRLENLCKIFFPKTSIKHVPPGSSDASMFSKTIKSSCLLSKYPNEVNMLSTSAKESVRTKSRMSCWTHSILTPAALAFARALSKRYFVLSTPVTENPLFASAMLHLPGPQQRSRTVFPLGLVSVNTFGICLFAAAIRSFVNIKAYSSRQNNSSSNHSLFLLRVLIWLNCCMHYEDRCKPPNRQRPRIRLAQLKGR